MPDIPESVLVGLIIFAVFFGAIVWSSLAARWRRRGKSGGAFGGTGGNIGARKSEALFRTMFPDLQPHFHPRQPHRVREGA